VSGTSLTGRRPRLTRRRLHTVPGASDGPHAPHIEPRVADNARDAAELRGRVETVARGGARAAVLGVNDGLVTNVCLILALSGASASVSQVRTAGFASLIAGAFSMAAGEWVSVRSQVELYHGILGELRSLVQRNPRLVLDELTEKLEETGFAHDTAQRVASELPLDESKFLDFSARTVFGFNPDELGSPLTAALGSLVLFTAGASVPLAPWLFTGGGAATLASLVATAVAGLLVGGWISRSAGRPVLRGALRQLLIVVAAAAVTYGIGGLFGTAVG
jgi:vacuolar iron transporter family protein